MALSQDQLDELKTKHARIAHVVGKDQAWEAVFRKPTRAEYKAFRARVHNPAQLPDAQEILCRATVVHPSPEEFDRLLDDYPAIPEAASKAIGDLVGMSVDESAK